MNASKAKFGDTDEDYWRHAEDHRWDSKCRIKHRQPTWCVREGVGRLFIIAFPIGLVVDIG